MKREGAEGLSADRHVTAAANEDFTGMVSRREGATAKRPAGWDPYEVWRTRVKGPSKARKAGPRDRVR
ncbi:MAG: hypothetical protein ACRETG_12235 [Steroidobacteraceae bacterium]